MRPSQSRWCLLKKNCCQILKLTSNYSLFLTQIVPFDDHCFQEKKCFWLSIPYMHCRLCIELGNSQQWRGRISPTGTISITFFRRFWYVWRPLVLHVHVFVVKWLWHLYLLLNLLIFNFRPRTPTPALR